MIPVVYMDTRHDKLARDFLVAPAIVDALNRIKLWVHTVVPRYGGML